VLALAEPALEFSKLSENVGQGVPPVLIPVLPARVGSGVNALCTGGAVPSPATLGELVLPVPTGDAVAVAVSFPAAALGELVAVETSNTGGSVATGISAYVG
jgi:hypothetical protein